MTPEKLMHTENICLELGEEGSKVKILHDINLTIHAKEKLSIIVPSGSGKTSLMMLLSGLMGTTSGGIYFKDQAIHTMNEDKLAQFRQEHIGIVFQNFHLIPSLTALQNVAFPLSLSGDGAAEDEAKKWLEKVGLSHRLNHMPSQLSGGEQQRVALARALVMKPSMILADEPTGNLDSENGQMITELLFNMVDDYDTALILITHDNELAQKTNRIIKLVDGKIEHDIGQESPQSTKNKAN
jgi:putative ABC transport system ATP-binding protein